MEGLVVCATKRYQTSYLLVPEQGAGIPVLGVALTTVPATLLQVVEEVSKVALAQSSFTGGNGSCIQISKLPNELGMGFVVVEYTRTK